MNDKTTTGADLVAAISNNPTTAFRKEVTPKVNKDLVGLPGASV